MNGLADCLENHSIPISKSLENLIQDSGNRRLTFINIHCPPFLSLSDFNLEFQSVFEFILSSPFELMIMDDFNIHTDTLNYASQKFQDLFSVFSIMHHLTFPLHDMPTEQRLHYKICFTV